MDTFSLNNYVSLNKVKIHNSLYSNILSQGSNLSATNCLFANSNNYSAFISIGGNINFEALDIALNNITKEEVLNETKFNKKEKK